MISFKKKLSTYPKSAKVFFGILSSCLFIVLLFWIISFGKESTDDSQVTDGKINLSERPGIGFEGQNALYDVMKKII